MEPTSEAIKAFLKAVVGDPNTNYLIALVLALPFVDWGTGWLRSLYDKAFEWQAFDVFLKESGAKAVGIVVLLLIGRVLTVGAPGELTIPGLDLSILIAGGVLAAVPFVLTTVASILANVNTAKDHAVPS